MSERLTVCNKCGSRSLTTLEVINPDTTDMNMNAKLKCNGCGEEGIYIVASNHYREQRRRGFIRQKDAPTENKEVA